MITRLTNLFTPRIKTQDTDRDNRVAILADINNVVDEMNANFGFVNHIIAISQSGTAAPTRKYMTTGDIDNCKSNCSGGTGTGCVCDCPDVCLNEVATSTELTFSYNGVGDYTLTAKFLGTVYAKGIYNVALFMSPVKDTDHLLSVSSTSNASKTEWSFSIKTSSSSLGPADAIIDGLFAEVKVFTYKN